MTVQKKFIIAGFLAAAAGGLLAGWFLPGVPAPEIVDHTAAAIYSSAPADIPGELLDAAAEQRQFWKNSAAEGARWVSRAAPSQLEAQYENSIRKAGWTVTEKRADGESAYLAARRSTASAAYVLQKRPDGATEVVFRFIAGTLLP